jgi:CDP-diacylglycerol--glycerol-3-phosphate 3-phosphatidyltransferase
VATDGRTELTETPDGESVLEPHWFNLPNAFTFLRVLLVPVILGLLLVEGDGARWWAFGVFVFAAVTDSIDGWVARRYNGITRWGQLADPIADKLLVLGALGALALVGELPWWAVIVILAREVAVTWLRLRLVQRRRLVLPASTWGKAKTVSQVVAIAAILSPSIGTTVSTTLLYAAVVLTTWSGVDYAFVAGRVARSVPRDEPVQRLDDRDVA